MMCLHRNPPVLPPMQRRRYLLNSVNGSGSAMTSGHQFARCKPDDLGKCAERKVEGRRASQVRRKPQLDRRMCAAGVAHAKSSTERWSSRARGCAYKVGGYAWAPIVGRACGICTPCASLWVFREGVLCEFTSIITRMHTPTQAAVDSPDHRIGVTVLTGFLGSGKTTLLNRLVRHAAYADAAVIVNELGEIGVDHHLIRHAEGRVAVIEGGCICCNVNGPLVDTLRELFMLALRRQIPRFRHVLIETTGLATPQAVIFTLRHEPFLAQRYVHRATMTVVDMAHIATQLTDQPEAAQQVAAADVIVGTKSDLVQTQGVEPVISAVRQINPGAPVILQRLDEPLDEALTNLSSASVHKDRGALGRWLGGVRATGGVRHPHVRHAAMAWTVPVGRASFLVAMSQLQEAHHEGLLRIKGVVGFDGDEFPCAIHGVHRDLYPLEPLMAWPGGERQSWVVIIARELPVGTLLQELRPALGLSDNDVRITGV